MLGWDRARLLADAARTGARRIRRSAIDALVARRAAREPLAYIVGHREFWGLDFEVTPDVLIPRPETELIVEEALAPLPRRPPPVAIVDVGTGSGCLAVALALEWPDVGRRRDRHLGGGARRSRGATPRDTASPTASRSCEADLLPRLADRSI